MRVKIQNLQAINEEQSIVIAQLIPKSEETATINGASMKVTDIPLVKEIVERDPEEDARIIQILKGIDEENSKQTAAVTKKKTKKKKATKQKVTAKAKKAKSPAKKKKKKATKKKSKKKVQVESEKVDFFMEAIEETSLGNKIDEKNDAVYDHMNGEVDEIMAFISATDAANASEDNVKAEVLDAVSETRMDDVQTTVKSKKKTKSKKKKKKAKKSVKAKKQTPLETQPDALNPWGELKQSTLQRKTIAQLTAYLEERVSYYESVSNENMFDI